MRVGHKELRAVPVLAAGGRPAIVRLVIMMLGIPMTQEEAAPGQVRQLARELMAAADAAEGVSSGQQ